MLIFLLFILVFHKSPRFYLISIIIKHVDLYLGGTCFVDCCWALLGYPTLFSLEKNIKSS